MPSPFFSIIIPTYNRAHILARAVQSVLDQECRDLELILVDDGSTDQTREVVDSWRDERLHYLYQANAGVSAARNRGARESYGRYLVFLDSDDYLERDCLRRYRDAAQQGATLLFCDLIKSDEQHDTCRVVAAREGKDYGAGNFIPGSFCVARELFMAAGGYDDTLAFAENAELSYRLWQLRPVTAYTDAVGLHYEVSPDGGNRNLANIVRSCTRIVAKHEGTGLLTPHLGHFFLQSAAMASMRLGRQVEGRELLLAAWRYQPWQVKTFLKWCIARFPALARRFWPVR